jgi:hypothetical protein
MDVPRHAIKLVGHGIHAPVLGIFKYVEYRPIERLADA